jgi:hypothetical protein
VSEPRTRALARGAAGVALAFATLAGVAALAGFSAGAPPADGALRLSLRTARARFELCRERTAEELAALSAHMRQARVCTEVAVDYRLEVAVDGATRVDRRISHRGVRRTRPLVAGELLRVTPGAHRVEVRFLPIDPPAGAADLPRPVFAGTLDFPRGRVRLLTLTDGGELRAAGGD